MPTTVAGTTLADGYNPFSMPQTALTKVQQLFAVAPVRGDLGSPATAGLVQHAPVLIDTNNGDTPVTTSFSTTDTLGNLVKAATGCHLIPGAKDQLAVAYMDSSQQIFLQVDGDAATAAAIHIGDLGYANPLNANPRTWGDIDIACGDLDGDGVDEIAVAASIRPAADSAGSVYNNPGPGQVYVYKFQGNHAYAPLVKPALTPDISLPCGYTLRLAMGDTQGAGKDQLVVVSSRNTTFNGSNCATVTSVAAAAHWDLWQWNGTALISNFSGAVSGGDTATVKTAVVAGVALDDVAGKGVAQIILAGVSGDGDGFLPPASPQEPDGVHPAKTAARNTPFADSSGGGTFVTCNGLQTPGAIVCQPTHYVATVLQYTPLPQGSSAAATYATLSSSDRSDFSIMSG